jgi:heme exporter protein D
VSLFWKSWSDFFAMGGYGVYVWGSVGVFALFMLVEMLMLRQRRRAALEVLDDLRRDDRTA